MILLYSWILQLHTHTYMCIYIYEHAGTVYDFFGKTCKTPASALPRAPELGSWLSRADSWASPKEKCHCLDWTRCWCGLWNFWHSVRGCGGFDDAFIYIYIYLHFIYIILLYYIILYYIILYYIILYYIILFYILNYIILYYIILYYIILYFYIILYYVKLYYIILYYITLYYIMYYYIMYCYVMYYYVMLGYINAY